MAEAASTFVGVGGAGLAAGCFSETRKPLRHSIAGLDVAQPRRSVVMKDTSSLPTHFFPDAFADEAARVVNAIALESPPGQGPYPRRWEAVIAAEGLAQETRAYTAKDPKILQFCGRAGIARSRGKEAAMRPR